MINILYVTYILLLGKPRRDWHEGTNCKYHTLDEACVHIHRLIATAVYMLCVFN